MIPYQDVRDTCSRLMWQISKEVNQISVESMPFWHRSELKPITLFTQYLEFLGGVVVDDWVDIKDVHSDIERLPALPCHNNPFIDGLWNELCALISKHSGSKVLVNFHSDDEPMEIGELREDYIRLGLDLQLLNKGVLDGKCAERWVVVVGTPMTDLSDG